MSPDVVPSYAGPLPGGALVSRVHRRVLAADRGAVDDGQLAAFVRDEAPLLGPAEVTAVVARVRARIGGVGPLEPFLTDPEVTDVLVNGPGPVWVERLGRLERTDVVLGPGDVALLIERVVAPLGLRADRATPIVDARLPDGSRAHIVLAPIAVDGPSVAIRRFGATTLPIDAFCTPPVADLLRWAVDARLNIVVSGATGAGKTTLLNALCGRLPDGERVVTIEDAAELRLPGDHVVRLETRPASPDGLAAVPIRQLVRAALRMRPDRLVVGEVRGAEALDMIQALSTGHDGSLSSCHANGPTDALRRIEVMALAGAADLPLVALREQVTAAVDLVVHVARAAGGRRRVTGVAEVADDPEAPVSARTRSLVADGAFVARPTRRRRPDAPPAPGLGGPADAAGAGAWS
jgi:pilus assembly protein CpaF